MNHQALFRGLWALCLVSVAGCASGPDLESFRVEFERPRIPERRGDLQAEIQQVEAQREDLQLADSRDLALILVSEYPEDQKVLYLASRAASDTVFLEDPEDKARRDRAAAAALDYSKRMMKQRMMKLRMMKSGAFRPEQVAQHAWALGNSTHLQPMFDRDDHASVTMEAIESALSLDQDSEVALRTQAILMYRLATLPWIAKLFASGAPEGDLTQAIECARRAVAIKPSLENRLALLIPLIEADELEAARIVFQAGKNQEDAYPRDSVLRAKFIEIGKELDRD